MGVGFGSFETARSGMFVNERGLYVTGHNISNLNTPGYVRQQAMIADVPASGEYGSFQIGLGASIEEIRQVRHSFLDNIYRQENSTLGYWQAKSETLHEVESIMGEPMEDGLQTVMNQFWDSWQELSKEPESLTVRAVVRQRGEALAYQLNHLGSQLDKLQTDINTEITVRIDEINQITGKIARLNGEILKAEVAGDTANDYRDQRNLLIDDLTSLTGADAYEEQDGQFSVTANGYYLVQRTKSAVLYAGKNNEHDVFSIPKIAEYDIELPLTTGTLKGLMESRGQESYVAQSGTSGDTQLSGDILSQLKKNLDILTTTLYNSVNDIHKSGKTVNNGTTADGSTFFSLIDAAKPISMQNIKLNDNLDDLNNIVASEKGDTGDNAVALKIANLRHNPLIQNDMGVFSMDDYYRSIVLNIGSAGSDADSIAQNQFKLVQSADDKRQSIVGVSMDEEMTNMLKYKFAYNASARTINVLDEMLDTVISKTGITGR